MKITNKYGLPQAMVNAITTDNYTKGNTWSYSQLSEPPQITQLCLRHDSELEEDVSDRIWMLLGSAVHYILEHRAGEGDIPEQRLVAELNGHKISGKSDLHVGNTIHDYKVTSAWTAIFDPNGKPEWTNQMNCYAWLARKNGYPVNKIEIIAILRDWVERKAREDASYPPIPVKQFNIKLWTDEQAETYLIDRINKHIAAESLSDDQLPECTKEEMWYKPGKFALMKRGNKRAVQLFDNQGFAERALAVAGSNHYTEERNGSYPRCDGYCPVSNFCHQKKRRECGINGGRE